MASTRQALVRFPNFDVGIGFSSAVSLTAFALGSEAHTIYNQFDINMRYDPEQAGKFIESVIIQSGV